MPPGHIIKVPGSRVLRARDPQQQPVVIATDVPEVHVARAAEIAAERPMLGAERPGNIVLQPVAVIGRPEITPCVIEHAVRHVAIRPD